MNELLVNEYHKVYKNIDLSKDSKLIWIYMFYSKTTGLYKIGITVSHPKTRMQNIASGSGTEIEIVYAAQVCSIEDGDAYQIEQMLHRFYFDIRRIGEWFDFTNKDVVEIVELLYWFEEAGIIYGKRLDIIDELMNSIEDEPFLIWDSTLKKYI